MIRIEFSQRITHLYMAAITLNNVRRKERSFMNKKPIKFAYTHTSSKHSSSPPLTHTTHAEFSNEWKEGIKKRQRHTHTHTEDKFSEDKILNIINYHY